MANSFSTTSYASHHYHSARTVYDTHRLVCSAITAIFKTFYKQETSWKDVSKCFHLDIHDYAAFYTPHIVHARSYTQNLHVHILLLYSRRKQKTDS